MLLTGASGGIGAAIARALHGRGAVVVASGRRLGQLEALREELGSRVEPVVSDLTQAEAPRRLLDSAGVVDVLVANAGLPGTGTMDAFSEDEMDRALAVNLRAPMQLARLLVPAMLERRSGGHLVFISSTSGKVVSPNSSVYAATKFGLRGFAAGLRDDLHGTGVSATAVFPGPISDAGMWADAGLETPPGMRLRSPEQVAAAVIRGIERDRGEIDVAAPEIRFSAMLAGLAPGLVSALQRRAGGTKVSAALTEAQRDKR
ncbi:MAG: SDR family NAD(P)-dependent oxidoreductase [Thermoleophilaceae bacterium]